MPDEGFTTVEGQRVRLRRFGPADLDAFVAYRADPDVARYQSWDAGYSRAEGEQFLQWVTAIDPGVAGEWYQFAIERTDQPGLIGDCAAHYLAADRVAVGFTMSPARQGAGLATEAVGLLLGYLSRHGITTVDAWVEPANHRSAALLRRLGFDLIAAADDDHYRRRLVP